MYFIIEREIRKELINAMNSFTDSLQVKAIILLIVAAIILGLTYYEYKLYTPANGDQKIEKVIKIDPGSSLVLISQKLAQENLINNPFIFKTYVKLKGLEDNIQAGYYKLNSKLTIVNIVKKLASGQTATYQFTIPEGATVEEIAVKVDNKGYQINKKKFLRLAKQKKLNFLANIEQTKYNLEGFLFPETYRFSYGSSEEKIINKMLAEFKRRVNPLKAEIKRSGYSLYQIITIASLIEAEAKVKEELSLISSVIYNRLQRRMRLQLDATIQYILPQRKDRLFYSDLEVESLYNTYQYYGLPPGPINNPGLETIKAALNPAQTDYLYYVAIGNGRHKFTKTYRQHLKVQRELKREQ